jgi:hypothetical protein
VILMHDVVSGIEVSVNNLRRSGSYVMFYVRRSYIRSSVNLLSIVGTAAIDLPVYVIAVCQSFHSGYVPINLESPVAHLFVVRATFGFLEFFFDLPHLGRHIEARVTIIRRLNIT